MVFSWLICGRFVVDLWYFCSIFVVDLWWICGIFVVFSWYFYGIFMVDLWSFYGIFMVDLLYFCSIFMVYFWSFYGIFMVDFWYFYGIFMVDFYNINLSKKNLFNDKLNLNLMVFFFFKKLLSVMIVSPGLNGARIWFFKFFQAWVHVNPAFYYNLIFIYKKIVKYIY